MSFKKYLITLLAFSVVLIGLPSALSRFISGNNVTFIPFMTLLIWLLSLSQSVAELSDRLKSVVLIWLLSGAVLTLSYAMGLVFKGDVRGIFSFMMVFVLGQFLVLIFLIMVVKDFKRHQADVSESRKLLSALANMGSVPSLSMTVHYLDNRSLRQEAVAAVVKIAEVTAKDHPEKTKAALEKALASADSDTIKQQIQQLLDGIK